MGDIIFLLHDMMNDVVSLIYNNKAMKKLITLLLIICSLSLFAQEPTMPGNPSNQPSKASTKNKKNKKNKKKRNLAIVFGANMMTQNTYIGTVESGGTDKGSGIFLGLYEESNHLVAGLYYVNAKNSENGGSANFLFGNLQYKANFSEKFSSMAGIQYENILSSENTTKMSWSIVGGIRYKFSNKFFLLTQYSYGLTNMIDYPGYESKMNHFNFSLGYFL